MINTKLQNIIDTKSAIGNAINNKGGSITVDTPFYEYAPAIENISTGGGAYSTWVVQSETNALYTTYNGYDFAINPNPNLSNRPFNSWLLNNSATGDIVLSNTILTSNGTFNGPNTVLNESALFFVQSSSVANGIANVITSFEGNIYVGTRNTGFNAVRINRLLESNIQSITANSPITNRVNISTIQANNGFVYIGHNENAYDQIQKYNASTLSLVGNSASTGILVTSIAINNGSIYVAHFSPNGISQIFESNLTKGLTYNASTRPIKLKTHNGFIYLTYQNGSMQKIHENNLVLNSTYTSGVSSNLSAFDIDSNGDLYIGFDGSNIFRKLNSNFGVLVNTTLPNASNRDINAVSEFVYVKSEAGLTKHYKSNLVQLANTTPSGGFSVIFNGGFVFEPFPTGSALRKIRPYNIATFDNTSLFSITNVKE